MMTHQLMQSKIARRFVPTFLRYRYPLYPEVVSGYQPNPLHKRMRDWDTSASFKTFDDALAWFDCVLPETTASTPRMTEPDSEGNLPPTCSIWAGTDVASRRNYQREANAVQMFAAELRSPEFRKATEDVKAQHQNARFFCEVSEDGSVTVFSFHVSGLRREVAIGVATTELRASQRTLFTGTLYNPANPGSLLAASAQLELLCDTLALEPQETKIPNINLPVASLSSNPEVEVCYVNATYPLILCYEELCAAAVLRTPSDLPYSVKVTVLAEDKVLVELQRKQERRIVVFDVEHADEPIQFHPITGKRLPNLPDAAPGYTGVTARHIRETERGIWRYNPYSRERVRNAGMYSCEWCAPDTFDQQYADLFASLDDSSLWFEYLAVFMLLEVGKVEYDMCLSDPEDESSIVLPFVNKSEVADALKDALAKLSANYSTKGAYGVTADGSTLRFPKASIPQFVADVKKLVDSLRPEPSTLTTYRAPKAE